MCKANNISLNPQILCTVSTFAGICNNDTQCVYLFEFQSSWWYTIQEEGRVGFSVDTNIDNAFGGVYHLKYLNFIKEHVPCEIIRRVL